MFQFHRKEQFDIINGGVKNPIIVIGWKTPDSYSRLLVRVKAEGYKSLGDWIEAQAYKGVRPSDVCPECDGTGDNPTGDSVSTDCPACGGSGKC